MMNNRKVINSLNRKIEYLENRNGILKLVNRDLIKDIDEKDAKITTLLEKIDKYEQILEEKELKICEFNTKLCRAEGQLNDLDNYIKMTTGMSILDREDKE